MVERPYLGNLLPRDGEASQRERMQGRAFRPDRPLGCSKLEAVLGPLQLKLQVDLRALEIHWQSRVTCFLQPGKASKRVRMTLFTVLDALACLDS